MQKFTAKVTNIEWDTKDLSDLPNTIDIEVPVSEFSNEDEKNYYDIASEYVSDAISDQVGFCHNGFALEIYYIL